MLLSVTTTHQPATDLGYLVHKHPDAVTRRALSFGAAHVLFSEARPERCTMLLVLDVDTVDLVRGASELDQYVSERPWVASSFLSVAMAQTLRSAMAGVSRDRQALADTAIPLEVHLPTLPCRGGAAFLASLFEPLGYTIEARALPLDDAHPDWGPSHLFDVRLRATLRLADLLAHLYVLIPVLDDQKHYFVGEDEVEKLLRYGERWLAGHPQKEAIARRYLARRGRLTRLALARLCDDEDPDEALAEADVREAEVERPLSLAGMRAKAVLAALREEGVTSVADVGCGEGHLLGAMQRERWLTRIVGVDVSLATLRIAQRRLDLDRATVAERDRLQLLHGSLVYKDERLRGLDAVVCTEVIEHIDPERLELVVRGLFGWLRPRVVVLTTPNVEYNVLFPTLAAGALRHGDHRFEWDRATFAAWCAEIGATHGYRVALHGVGAEDPNLGCPTQLATLVRDP